MSAVSSEFLSTLQHALREELHFAGVEEVPLQPQAGIVIVSGQELGPTHSSLRSLLIQTSR